MRKHKELIDSRGGAPGERRNQARGVRSRSSRAEEDSCLPFPTDQSKLQKLTERLRDEIVRREAAETALQESERRLDMALSGAELGLWDWDLETGEVVFNERWAEMLGFSLEEIEPHFSAEDALIHPDDKTVHDRVMASHLNGKTPFFECEHRLRCKSGQWRWVLDRGKVVERDKRGRPLRVAGVHVDITDLKTAQEELRESRELFAAFMDFLPAGALILKGDGEIIYVNQFLREVFGASEWIGRSANECARKLTALPLISDGSFSFETDPAARVISFPDANTGDRFFQTSTFPIIQPAKDPLYGVISLDVTEQKRMEDQLRQASKMQAVGTLAGGIAHDFNNILWAISGFTELALDDAPDGTALQSNLRHVLQAAVRAKGLVGQILTFSRQGKPEWKPIDVEPIVMEVVKFLQATVPASICIAVEARPDLEPIMGDSTQIHQVLMNLCTNAAHAMGLEGGCLDIKLGRGRMAAASSADLTENGAPACLTLRVIDTGHGMPTEIMERAFEPYFTTKPLGEGSGLGLAVAHGIVKSHGGTLEVRSRPGSGSEFTITIPFTHEDCTYESHACHDTGGLDAAAHEAASILFVDDELAISDMCNSMLSDLGFQVKTFCSSVEALELFQEQSDLFDLVITDLSMPTMNGVELARRIKHIRPNVPIILCTGYVTSVTERMVSALGIDALMYKPVLMAEMAETIRKTLAEFRGHHT